jgi:hypothetical protein
LIEAYWKSVLMPGQGVFIGEPLARPYGGYRVQQEGQNWFVSGPMLQPDTTYTLYAADTLNGAYTRVAGDLKPSEYGTRLQLPTPVRLFYRLQPQSEINLFTPPPEPITPRPRPPRGLLQ